MNSNHYERIICIQSIQTTDSLFYIYLLPILPRKLTRMYKRVAVFTTVKCTNLCNKSRLLFLACYPIYNSFNKYTVLFTQPLYHLRNNWFT